MKTGFYPKLAFDGIRKNRRMYVPVICTCIGMVMMFYIISYLHYSDTIASMNGGQIMRSTLNLGSIVVGIFSCIFLQPLSVLFLFLHWLIYILSVSSTSVHCPGTLQEKSRKAFPAYSEAIPSLPGGLHVPYISDQSESSTPERTHFENKNSIADSTLTDPGFHLSDTAKAPFLSAVYFSPVSSHSVSAELLLFFFSNLISYPVQNLIHFLLFQWFQKIIFYTQ